MFPTGMALSARVGFDGLLLLIRRSLRAVRSRDTTWTALSFAPRGESEFGSTCIVYVNDHVSFTTRARLPEARRHWTWNSPRCLEAYGAGGLL